MFANLNWIALDLTLSIYEMGSILVCNIHDTSEPFQGFITREMQVILCHLSAPKSLLARLEVGDQMRIGLSGTVVNFQGHSWHLCSCSSLCLEAFPVPDPLSSEPLPNHTSSLQTLHCYKNFINLLKWKFSDPSWILMYFLFLMTFNCTLLYVAKPNMW